MKTLREIPWLPVVLGVCLAVPVLGRGAEGDPPPELDVKIPRVKATDSEGLRILLGERAVVTGTLVRTRDWEGGINFLDFAGGGFGLVCFERNYGNFEKRPAVIYKGKSVEVIGIISEYKGKLQMELERPSQFLKVEAPAAPAEGEGETPEETGKEKADGAPGEGDEEGEKPEDGGVDPARYFDE